MKSAKRLRKMDILNGSIWNKIPMYALPVAVYYMNYSYTRNGSLTEKNILFFPIYDSHSTDHPWCDYVTWNEVQFFFEVADVVDFRYALCFEDVDKLVHVAVECFLGKHVLE